MGSVLEGQAGDERKVIGGLARDVENRRAEVDPVDVSPQAGRVRIRRGGGVTRSILDPPGPGRIRAAGRREKPTHATKNDLPPKTRTKVIALLNEILASAIDLKLRSKQAHWNVKGGNFIALHKHLDDVAEAVEEFADLIAERAVALGGGAEGLVPHVQGRSKLGPYPPDIFESRDHLDAITTSVSEFARMTRGAIDKTAAWKDAATADLFTEVTRDLDKRLWFLEAHLQGKA